MVFKKHRLALFFISILFVSNSLNAQENKKITCSHVKGVTNAKARIQQNTALNDYDVKHYFLDLELDNLSTFIKGNVSIKAQVKSVAMSQFVIELVQALQIDSIYFNSTKVNFSRAADEISVSLPLTLATNEIFEIHVFYQGDPQTGGFFSGISNGYSSPWGNQVTWTLSEPLNAKQWFPCKQVLGDKADSATIFITVPDHLKAGSNGLLTNTTPLPNNKTRFEWKTNYPIAYYLISISVAAYVDYSIMAEPAGHDPILIQNFVYDNPATLTSFKNDIDEVKDLIELFSELFGLYPFADEKYGHCMIPIGGGMEHQTMTSLGFFDFSLDAHELGHQWFGDNVTCASWQDIWVNEGFATYTEYLAYEFLRSKPEADAVMAANYADVISVPSGSVYVPLADAENENRIFDSRLSYEKGGALVHMIRNIINDDEVFFDLLKSYNTEFKNTVATGEDFKNLLEEKTEMEFDEFFEDWYYGQGYPVYKIEWNHHNDSIFVKQTQTTSNTTVNLFETPLEFKLKLNDRDSLVRFIPTQNQQLFQLYMPDEVTALSFDPNKWLLKKVNQVVRNNNLKGQVVPVITEVEQDLKNLISVYPNPVTDNVNVVYEGTESFDFTLMDTKGSRILHKNAIHHQLQFPAQEIAPGLYILQVAVNNHIHVQKLIIE